MEEKNNEMVELTTVDENPAVEVEVEETGMSTGLAMLIGSGLTLGVLAAVKKGREVWRRHKAQKATIEADAEMVNNADDDSEDDSEETQEEKK